MRARRASKAATRHRHGASTIEIIDTREVARREKKRKVVLNPRKLHPWVHCYPTPGDKDDVHCHDADQTFSVIEGE
jgi:hypothetical protein